MHRFFAFWFLMIVGIALNGCGYHHVGSMAGSHAGGKDGVHIPIFANKSYRPGLETVLTSNLVDEFARRSGGKTVDEAAAQFVLSGAVLSYSVTPVSYTAADKIREYRSTIKVVATLSDRQSGKTLWKGELSWSQDYPANSNIALQQNSEDAAVREICRRLAEQIREKTQEDF